ncbi:hypothetical protein [Enterovibrio sp. 27052020O]|uniref:hypothetical protein n=1 Tax=Enterovibrio sp. 27052020O TaxID=3241166 RepID=UPI00388EB25F
MTLIEKLNSTSTLSKAAIVLAFIVAALAIRDNTASNDDQLHKYLQMLPSVALAMVKTQSSLEASDGKVLLETQITMLENSFSKLLARQSSSFEQRRLAMKIEIIRKRTLVDGAFDSELHRFGYIECEPDVVLGSPMMALMETNLSIPNHYPKYQVTLCYLNRDGSILKTSASSAVKQ